MGSVPNHSNSTPYLINTLTPESSQFIAKIESMKVFYSLRSLKIVQTS